MAKVIGKPAEHGTLIVKSLQFQKAFLISTIWILVLHLVFLIIGEVIALSAFSKTGQPIPHFQSWTYSVFSFFSLLGLLGFFTGDASGMLSKTEIFLLVVSAIPLPLLHMSINACVFVFLQCLAYIYVCWKCRSYIKQTDITIAQYRSGIRGETNTADELAKLPDNFTVIHGLPFDAGDIDHLVIGPSGIFAIDTKNIRGRIEIRDAKLFINGEPSEKDYLLQVRQELEAVTDSVQIPDNVNTESLLVFPRGDISETVKAGIRIMTLSHLAPYILGKPESMDESVLKDVVSSMKSMYGDGKKNDKERQFHKLYSNRFQGVKTIVLAVATILITVISGAINKDND